MKAHYSEENLLTVLLWTYPLKSLFPVFAMTFSQILFLYVVTSRLPNLGLTDRDIMQTPQKEREEVSCSASAAQRNWDTRQTQRTKRIKRTRDAFKLFSQGQSWETHTLYVCVQQRKSTWKLVSPLRVQCGRLVVESHGNKVRLSSAELAVHQ